MSSPLIRPLTGDDIPQALELSSQAGWNQVAEDWRTVVNLDSAAGFALDCEGQLAATATLVCYGQRLAWLGMVLTKPEFQRRGFARMLVKRALAEADHRRIQTVKLDATAQGRPLYESLGFFAEQEVQRWSGNGGLASGCEAETEVGSLDSSAFAADRRFLLDRLALRARPLINGKGFAMHRDGLRATYLGPCVACSPERAKRLITTVLARVNGPLLWDLLPSNTDAVSLATSLGFRIDRRLVRMSRGAPFRENESTIYAIAGFEFG